jgi:8-oxo-dGTP pyrophosphatase MutT (NUDIX family)
MKKITLNMEYDPVTIEFIKTKFVRQNLKGHVLAVILVDDKILLVQRRNSSTKNKLCLPGGNVTRTETYLEGMKREIKEELGIDVQQTKLLSGIENRYLLDGKCICSSKGKIYLVTRYVGSVEIENKELEGFVWCGKNNIPRLKFKNDQILSYIFSNKTKDLILSYSKFTDQ